MRAITSRFLFFLQRFLRKTFLQFLGQSIYQHLLLLLFHYIFCHLFFFRCNDCFAEVSIFTWLLPQVMNLVLHFKNFLRTVYIFLRERKIWGLGNILWPLLYKSLFFNRVPFRVKNWNFASIFLLLDRLLQVKVLFWAIMSNIFYYATTFSNGNWLNIALFCLLFYWNLQSCNCRFIWILDKRCFALIWQNFIVCGIFTILGSLLSLR